MPDTDSTVICRVNLFNGGAVRGIPLKLKTLKGSRRGVMYDYRPFEINEYDASDPEIPLMLYASFWFDEKSNRYHFCAAKRGVKKDLSSDITKMSPHFYVIGVRIEEVK